jgi:malonate transporter and related proteins
MFQIIAALTPIFVLILMGWIFRKTDFPGESFWPMAERLTYFLFFPALLFNSLFTADFADLPVLPVVVTVALAMSLVSILMLALRPRLGLSSSSFSSFFQGGLRPNTYVGISAAFMLYADQGLAAAALVIAVMIPLSNLFSVIAVSTFCSTRGEGWMRTLGALVSNPLILACLLGIGANQAGLELYSGFKEVVVVLSQASLPLGLLCVGAGLHLRGLTGDRTAVAMASLIKLLILPGLALLLALILGLKQEFAAVTLIFAALPCGPAAYVLARQLGGDTPLMAKIITIQTLLAFFTLPLILGFFGT